MRVTLINSPIITFDEDSMSLLAECKDDKGEVVAEVGDLEVKLLQPLLSLVSRVRKNWHLRSLKRTERQY